MAEAPKGPQSRMSITNLVNGTTLTAQFNPTEIEEAIEANWNELEVLGLSHRPLQYQSTSNHQFSFTLRFDNANLGRRSPAVLGFGRNFLLATLYPPGLPEGSAVGGAAPPRLLFEWPGVASMIAVIRSIKMRHFDFNKRSGTKRFDASIVLSEIRDFRLTMEDLIDQGPFRSGGGVTAGEQAAREIGGSG